MKVSMHGGFLILISVLQATWLNYIEILGVKPNLFLVYILIISFYCSKAEGAIVGFTFGLILDIIIGRFLGVNAVMCAVAGFYTAYFCEKILGNKNMLIVMIVTALASILYEFIYYVIVFLGVGKINLGYAFKNVILIESLYNVIIVALLYPMIKKISKFIYADKGESIG